MRMLVTKEFTFHAAHYVTDYHGACERLHGHTYKLHVAVEGPVHNNGMVLDFAILKKIVKEKVLSKCDHYLLNDFLPNPTTEHLVMWVWEQLSDLPTLLKAEADHPNISEEIRSYLKSPENATKDVPVDIALKRITIWETPTSFASYPSY